MMSDFDYSYLKTWGPPELVWTSKGTVLRWVINGTERIYPMSFHDLVFGV